MTHLPPSEVFIIVVYLIMNAYIARAILKEKKAEYLHKYAFSSLLIGLALIWSLSV